MPWLWFERSFAYRSLLCITAYQQFRTFCSPTDRVTWHLGNCLFYLPVAGNRQAIPSQYYAQERAEAKSLRRAFGSRLWSSSAQNRSKLSRPTFCGGSLDYLREARQRSDARHTKHFWGAISHMRKVNKTLLGPSHVLRIQRACSVASSPEIGQQVYGTYYILCLSFPRASCLLYICRYLPSHIG